MRASRVIQLSEIVPHAGGVECLLLEMRDEERCHQRCYIKTWDQRGRRLDC
ncbi:uncharacterized protein MELLADRAFT_92762 [Melampsora larici-populina 98AG31]|uniref:Uncharacterized protein n=1 Tax=Melampsora larici-populina (strain 98AG31 / pathotype 3-4-7) TaxID=747676 RepID=F4S2N2_MELLP|nr:uncharacterized protein MELLADRAFT_92762 [Melampsora larici-populina 98AG31]EGG01099.1 hypothetical protein MELLADRAFT_92762 [Melampsora larici-populina 98AG31]